MATTPSNDQPKQQEKVDNTGQYWYSIFEDGKPLKHMEVIDDPFANVRLELSRGAWWRVLLFGKRFSISIGGTRASHRVVFMGDYTPPPPGLRISEATCNEERKP